MRNTLALVALFLSSLPALANENVLPREELLRQGYRPLPKGARRLDSLPAAHALPWPAAFEDAAHSVGNSMAEFQPFGSPYFHGGVDIRTAADAELRAPVAGRLEAGHYGYNQLPDGSLEKLWKPWPQQGDFYYFEVAVVAGDGTRYELHHVNRRSLPAEIVALLNAGGGRVEAGTLLARVIPWPDGVYHHTHYNIILPSGKRVNPEFASTLVPDSLAPELLGLFAIGARNQVLDFGNGSLPAGTKEIIADVRDLQDGNVYEHPPVLARLRFASGEETAWDFRETLAGADGLHPPLWDVFLERLRTPGGGYRETEGGYGTGHSLIRLKVPSGAHGPFTLELGDIAGNITSRQGHL